MRLAKKNGERLDGKRIAALAADGFALIELLVPRKALIPGGFIGPDFVRQSLPAFVPAMIELFAGGAQLTSPVRAKVGVEESSPQAQQPLELAVKAARRGALN